MSHSTHHHWIARSPPRTIKYWEPTAKHGIYSSMMIKIVFSQWRKGERQKKEALECQARGTSRPSSITPCEERIQTHHPLFNHFSSAKTLWAILQTRWSLPHSRRRAGAALIFPAHSASQATGIGCSSGPVGSRVEVAVCLLPPVGTDILSDGSLEVSMSTCPPLSRLVLTDYHLASDSDGDPNPSHCKSHRCPPMSGTGDNNCFKLKKLWPVNDRRPSDQPIKSGLLPGPGKRRQNTHKKKETKAPHPARQQRNGTTSSLKSN